jgi:hypothetical protein
LDEPLPDHSTLSKIRQRSGVEVFRRFFEAIVERCQAAGLVWGQELYVDGTKVEANAAVDSLTPRFYVEAHLSHLFETGESGGEKTEHVVLQEEAQASVLREQEETSVPKALPTSLSAQEYEDLSQSTAARHEWTLRLGAPDRRMKERSSQRITDLRVSTTDPDATLMETGVVGAIWAIAPTTSSMAVEPASSWMSW